MIRVERTKGGTVRTKVKGEADDVAEQLLNGTITIIKILVESGNLDKELVNDFIDDFAQQIKDNLDI